MLQVEIEIPPEHLDAMFDVLLRLQDFDAVAPHRLLLVADQLVQSAMNIGLVLLCARAALIGSDTQGLMPLLAGVSWWLMLGWVLVNVVLAWRFSHPSILGEVLNMYCVRPCPQYPEHTQPAGLLRTAGAALLEGVLAACTLVGGTVGGARPSPWLWCTYCSLDRSDTACMLVSMVFRL